MNNYRVLMRRARVALSAVLLAVLASCENPMMYNSMEVEKETEPDLEVDYGSTMKYDIFLVAGQSNTHYGIGLDSKLDASDPDVFMVGRQDGFNNIIIPAAEPLHHWTRYSDRVGFALSFAKLYKKNKLKAGRKVLLVPCGYAGSSITQWGKGQNLYNDALLRVLTVLSEYPNSAIKGILWHQGEANVGWTWYETYLDQFIVDLRNSLGNPKIPFVLGGMVPYWVDQNTSRKNMQEILKNTPQRVDYAAYADPSYPTVIAKSNNRYDEYHFDAAGQREFGKRYYEAYITVPQN